MASTCKIDKSICVIGTGPAGLATLRYLSEKYSRIVAYETMEELGGLWVYSDKTGIDRENGFPVHNSVYKNLRYVFIVTIKKFILYFFVNVAQISGFCTYYLILAGKRLILKARIYALGILAFTGGACPGEYSNYKGYIYVTLPYSLV